MDAKEEGIILGELKAFRTSAETRLGKIEEKVEMLNRFKIKVTVIMAVILGGIELAFRALSAWGNK